MIWFATFKQCINSYLNSHARICQNMSEMKHDLMDFGTLQVLFCIFKTRGTQPSRKTPRLDSKSSFDLFSSAPLMKSEGGVTITIIEIDNCILKQCLYDNTNRIYVDYKLINKCVASCKWSNQLGSLRHWLLLENDISYPHFKLKNSLAKTKESW